MNDTAFQLPFDIWRVMWEHDIQLRNAITFNNMYGTGNARLFIKITPYVWLVPFLVTATILVVFKRARLFGYTQIYLIIIMVLDLLYTMLTSIRDSYLTFSQKDYGYIEYNVCRPLVLSMVLQTVLHGSSMWVKCLMTITHTIFIAFPLKCKSWNLKKWLDSVLIIHTVIVLVCISFPMITPLNGVKTFQLSRKVQKPKFIQACVLDTDTGFYETNLFQFMRQFLLYITFVGYMILPTAVNLTFVLMLIVLMRKQINLISILAPHTTKIPRIKYLTLIKVNVVLGISFLVQESPLLGYLGLLMTSEGLMKTLSVQCSYHMVMTTTFAFGKPLDLIIYASLSQTFRQEFLKLFKRNEKNKSTISPPLKV